MKKWIDKGLTRAPELARMVGTTMIAAALVAHAIKPTGFSFPGAIMLIISGFMLWFFGAVQEPKKEGDT